MKKILLAGLLGTIIWAGCKKREDERPSFLVAASRPTISFSGLPFYSIFVGGSVPDIVATAYDSTLGEAYPVSITGTDAIDNTTPGLYVIQAEAVNKFGLVGSQSVYVAVTNIPDSVDLSGDYARGAVIATIAQLARGLYVTDDVGGTGGATKTSALFVQITDSTLELPEQEVAGAGTIDAVNERVFVSGGDTTISYRFSKGGAFFNTTATRTFVKQ